MATSLQLPIASSISSYTSSKSVNYRSSNFKPLCAAKIPIPPINPKDPFLSKLASVAATSPEKLLNRPANSDTPPFLDLFEPPKLMATPAHVRTNTLSTNNTLMLNNLFFISLISTPFHIIRY